MSSPSEREPLLPQNGDSEAAAKRRLGPMEISPTNRRMILAGIWLATFLSSVNTTLVATLMTSISSDFQKAEQAGWLGTSYLLATCTFTPLYGRLCDVLGRRGANQAAVLFAGVGTLMCGLSGSMPTLILARFFSGIGGGGILTTATIITSDMYSMRSRGLAQGIQAIFNGAGMGFGGPLGGFIADRMGWRWAFLIQIPFFVISFMLTSANLRYVTPGKGRSKLEVLKRIDYGGSLTLMIAVFSLLAFLSLHYNAEAPLTSPLVLASLICSIVFAILFIVFELFIAPQPVMAPFLLKERVPVLVGISNFLVAMCNFTIMYFFPMWFQTVGDTDASTAGAHLLPNSISMSCGSLMAGYIMHRTGKYKMINLVFGIFPFLGAFFVSRLKADSPWVQQWFSIIPLGFGNAVVLQTTLVALLAHLPKDAMAVGTGFGQLFRGIGQVFGVGLSSAIFQYFLDRELRARLPAGPDLEELVSTIRHSAKTVSSLPPELQAPARASYGYALHVLFSLAAGSTALAYLVRLPLPGKSLDDEEHLETAPPTVAPTPRRMPSSTDIRGAAAAAGPGAGIASIPEVLPSDLETGLRTLSPEPTGDEDTAAIWRAASPSPERTISASLPAASSLARDDGQYEAYADGAPTPRQARRGMSQSVSEAVGRRRSGTGGTVRTRPRRFSTYEDTESYMDFEQEGVGSARR